MTLGFHADAEEELIEAAAYYEARVAGLGSRFISEVSRTLDLISTDSRLGSRGLSDTRRLRVARFPYSIIYLRDVVDIDIFVVAVAHSSREPAYWKARL